MGYSLRSATPHDLQTVIAWIESPAQLKLWGGPFLTYPPNTEKTWHEIEATNQNSFTLLSSSDCIVGFGQTLSRESNAIHLGRIIVSPEFRGHGLGRLLCNKLIQIGIQQFHPSRFTLNVNQNNLPAVSLYKALGFEILSENKEQNSYFMSLSV
ncbi:MAG: GNAT family N-acetyltransferase [Gammaproteobacteria bacterium]|nr:MAG: GNAT family N-acetyltransferase [Gammaproteobacteria bacterium]